MSDTERTLGEPEERQPAPEFNEGLDWINSDCALTLRELRGKVLLLDFWTYG